MGSPSGTSVRKSHPSVEQVFTQAFKDGFVRPDHGPPAGEVHDVHRERGQGAHVVRVTGRQHYAGDLRLIVWSRVEPEGTRHPARQRRSEETS